MKSIAGNRKKPEKTWKDKKGFHISNINQHGDGTKHPWNHNDSASDSDTTPQFQSENQ